MQQRGIPEVALDVLLEYGREAHDHRGAVITVGRRDGRLGAR
jgi:hypothetical protein